MDVAERPQNLTRARLDALARRLARVQSVVPLLTIFVWLCLLYGWEAWGNLTPWLFTDELEKTQLSRAIAETGHAARRTVPHSFDTLYVYLIAPAWFIHNTTKAYGAVKAIGVATMTSVLFPTYLLARMLVSKRWALFAAAGAAMVPVLSYSSLILEESLAYPYAALCFYLLAKAFVTRRRGWIAAAAIASLVAPFVRDQLAVLTAGAAIAAAAYWFTGEGGRRLRRNWTRSDWVGLVVLLVLFASVFDVVISHKSHIWYLATQYYKGRMLTYGLWAAGALTIGLGVLPTIAGLSSLVRPRDTPRSHERRAFTVIAAAMFAGFGFYTAVKAAYISTVGFSYLTERNLVYVAPLLFVGTALVLERGRAVIPAVLAATGFVMYVVTTTPYKMEFHFYFDAPGLSVLQSLNRIVALTPQSAKVLLILLTLASAAFLVLLRLGAPRVVTRAVVAAAAFVLVWNAYGEITGARSSHDFADRLLAVMPRPLNWVDQTVPKGADVYYLGQQITDPNGVELLEFWNRSVHHVWSTDATAPGPGPSVTPDVKKTDGLLYPSKGVEYMITDYGLVLRGKVLAVKYHTGAGVLPWTLYRVSPPLRLQQSIEGLYADGWGAPLTAYNQYSFPDRERRFLVVDVSRSGGGKNLPATVRVRVGRLKLGVIPPKNHQPILGKILSSRTLHVRTDLQHRFVFPAPKPPFRVETEMTPFSPYAIDPKHSSDRRTLGAQIGYSVVPVVPKPIPGRSPDVTGLYPDGWAGSDAAYTQWWAPFEQGGFARVTISRKNWTGPDVPSRVTITVSTLGYDALLGVEPKKVEAKKTWTVHSGTQRTFLLPTPAPPFRVHVHFSRLFVPHKLDPRSTDTRELGAQVSFGFRTI